MAPVRSKLGRPATWDDLDRVPDGRIGEIVAGEIVVQPRPNPPHTDVSSDLGALLGGWFRFGIGGPGGWILRDEPRIKLGDEIRVPDLAGWRAERYERKLIGPLTVVPDWICEVLSERTAAGDRSEKMPLYARHGVRHAWLIEPVLQILEVYRLEGEQWLLLATHAGAARVRAEPFDAVELDLSLVWGPPREVPAEEE